ncbi:MAG: putative DNA binding domain-containing protein [Oscillospiraceae bacterium]|nr:putative DNA binding domain-containing protein [Oscillospiraceae bacterium]MCL2278721.1 putative DNA binding domain-containing protein [Oscillospiraceae bacterium]
MQINWNELHQYRENNRVEAKKAVGGLPLSIWETYSAFANTAGGFILLGVEEQPDKSLRAIELPDPEKLVTNFWNTVNDRQKVNVNILTNKNVNIVEANGHRIIVIEIPRADRRDRPIYIGADPFAGSYRRNGEGDYHCSKDEVRNMMRDQSDISQDLRVLEQLGLDAFDYESVRRYRIRWQTLRPNHVWENLEDEDFLHKIGCVGRAESGTIHPTAAGILMFGFEYEIVKEFPNYFLDYQEHDDETIRWTDRIISTTGEWSGNLFDFYYRVYNRITQIIKTPFKLQGDTRIDDTPVHKAMREALANALIHANHYDRRGLVIHRYPKKITVANPGSLRISKDDAIFGGVSDPRNATLIKLFNLIEIGERSGSGLPNIFDIWKNEDWQEPKLEEQFNPDRTILSLVLSQQNSKEVAINGCDKVKVSTSDSHKQKIINYLTDNGVSKAGELANLLGVTGARVRVLMSQLTAEGAVVVDGANRNRTYRLK